MSQWRNVTDLLQEVETARIDSELTRFVFETPEPREPTPEERALPEPERLKKRAQQRRHKRQVRGAQPA